MTTPSNDPFVFDPGLADLAKVKLDIGAGLVQRKDDSWIAIDKFTEANVQADMGQLPFRDGSVDEIWSSHALEHLPRSAVLPTLAEWLRVLKLKGSCVIQVPDTDYACEVWMRFGDDNREALYGNQNHAGEFHLTGWTLGGLATDLRSVGFTVKKVESIWTPDYTQYSLRAEAIK